MKSAVREALLRLMKCPVKTDAPLAPLTTFKIGGPAAILAEPRNDEELKQLYRLLILENTPYFYLGLGSNLLVSDAGFDGVVIRATEDLCRMSMIRANIIEAGPGARLLDLTGFVAAMGLAGMEDLSGIPGSVGGGVFMNAGAYGGEIADHLTEVDVMLQDGTVRTMRHAEVGFAYRSAPALHDLVILNSRYELRPGEKENIYAEMRRVWKLRREKQPLQWPSAGSIFKRPPGLFAGKLIEDVHGKGLQIGGAQVSVKHAGIFINVGGATAADVTALVREIRSRVYRQFGILLEPEVRPVGFEEDPFDIAL